MKSGVAVSLCCGRLQKNERQAQLASSGDRRGKCRGCRRIEKDGGRQLDAGFSLDFQDQRHRIRRITAEVEKIVVFLDIADLQDTLENPDQRADHGNPHQKPVETWKNPVLIMMEILKIVNIPS